MDVIIENDKLKIKANTHGGEIHSIYGKKSNQEYLWKGVPFWWKIYCPTLFPVIGKLKHLCYKHDDKKFFMPQHGFAAKAKYTLLNKSQNEISFELKQNEEIGMIYPFKFSLITTYTIDDNKIIISFNVKNLDDKSIYFSIGSHPAFKCPMYGEEDALDDYYLEFESNENAYKKIVNKDDFLTRDEKKFLDNCSIINISQETFSEGTIILNNLKSNSVSLKSRKNNRSVKVSFGEFDTFSIWGPDRDARFICLEPWMGHADYEDFDGDIKDKEGIITLKENQEFNMKYSIEINE